MTTSTYSVRKPAPVVLRDLTEDELLFYVYFTALHGGALNRVRPDGRDFRLIFPTGTRKLPNEESGLPLTKSCVLLYPDGTRVLWFARYVLDGKERRSVLLFPVRKEGEAMPPLLPQAAASCG